MQNSLATDADTTTRNRWSTTIAIALYVFIADLVVETLWSGVAPVRWLVAGAAASFVLVTVSLWKRTTVAKAAASSFFVLGLVAACAWLPGGLVAGIRAAGRSTSTIY